MSSLSLLYVPNIRHLTLNILLVSMSLALLSRTLGKAGNRWLRYMVWKDSITLWSTYRMVVHSSGALSWKTGADSERSPSTTRLKQAFQATTTTISCLQRADGMFCTSMVLCLLTRRASTTLCTSILARLT